MENISNKANRQLQRPGIAGSGYKSFLRQHSKTKTKTMTKTKAKAKAKTKTNANISNNRCHHFLPAIRAVEETRRVAAAVLVLEHLPVARVQT